MLPSVARALMLQGTGTYVGKSLLVAGLCRHFAAQGIRVAPFKPQNMSNNAAVTIDNGEIGRAQALQARAANRPAHTDMNPVLLKPQQSGAQILVHGRVWHTAKATDYGTFKPHLMNAVMASYQRLAQMVDLVLIEGAGSAAETNLREQDIANMGFAERAGCAVVIVGDIDRGGVIAQLVGTHAVLSKADRARVIGCVVNKFRGEQSLFAAAVPVIEQKTAWPLLGIVPWIAAAKQLPAEDSMALATNPPFAPAPALAAQSAHNSDIVIVVPRLPHIANFDDCDPLVSEIGVQVHFAHAHQVLRADAHIVLLLGSKSVLSDMAFLREQGWDIDIYAHVRRGGAVLGLCGGYQMLGQTIADPQGIEGNTGTVQGLGLLCVDTILHPDKTLRNWQGMHKGSGHRVSGYEIHCGQTHGADCARAWLSTTTNSASDKSGHIQGCYVHGLFAGDAYRHWYLERTRAKHALTGQTQHRHYNADIDTALNSVAAHVAQAIDTQALLQAARPICV